MPQLIETPLVIIGAGAAGLVLAIGASKLGKKCLLIEKSHYGGDCTHFGCIPSKTLIEASKIAQSLNPEYLNNFGLSAHIQNKQFHQVFDHIHSTIQHFESEENPEALKKHGVQVLEGTASFIDPYTLSVLDTQKKLSHVKFQKAYICCGSKPSLPNIPGLHNIKFYTNESIFSLDKLPKHLGIIGGGAMGCEMAQAFLRLGTKVSIIEKSAFLMPDFDRQLSKKLQQILISEGAQIHLQSSIESFEKDSKQEIIIEYLKDLQRYKVSVTHLLIATGRSPNCNSLNLEAARVQYSPKGITVNEYGQSSQKHIFALGDIIPGSKATHYAEYQARQALYNLMLPSFLWKKLNPPSIKTLFTDPEWSEIGLNEKQALKQYSPSQLKIYEMDLLHCDRAITSLKTQGRVKVITKKWSGKILGASLIMPCAGEVVNILGLAINNKLSIRHLQKLLVPYPSYSRLIRQLADKYYTEHLFPSLKKCLKLFGLFS